MTPGAAQAALASPKESSFAADVRAGLTRAGQKTLSPKYLYDELGSTLFEAITQLPEYGLWRAESALLETHAAEIASLTRAATVVEFGSGSATKTMHLLKALLRTQPVCYCPIDVSAAALDMTRRALAHLRNLAIHGIEDDYLDGLDTAMQLRSARGPVLALFLGSSLGNLDSLSSLRFLQCLRGALRPGDHLLIGADLEKPEERLLAAYDDALGVTAAFNLNLLARINRELGANFELPQFRHRARFNRLTRDVEMHLESRIPQTIDFPHQDFSVSFRSGETLHTENSHKYAPEELDRLATAAGLRPAARWLHEEWRFASALYAA